MKRVLAILFLAGVLGAPLAEAGLIRDAAKIARKAGKVALRFIW